MIFYTKQRSAILLFHRVLPQRDPLWDPIDPSLFSKTLKYISKKFHVVSINEILFERNTAASKPLAALTFDDGYRDFIDYAIPVLDEEKMKASMYVVTDCIDNGLPTWTYIVDHLFANSKKLEWTNYDVTQFSEQFRNAKWNSKEERMNYCRQFKQNLKWFPALKRAAIIKSLMQNFDDVSIPLNTMMNWDEVNQVSNAGFDIGSHSTSHPSLSTIEDESVIRNELIQSAKKNKRENRNNT